MTPSTLLAIKQQLLTELKTLESKICLELSHSNHPKAEAMLDQIQHQPSTNWPELLQLQLSWSLTEYTQRLEAVLAALSLIELNNYGTCADCEREIPLSLLQQDPARQRCELCEPPQKETQPGATAHLVQ